MHHYIYMISDMYIKALCCSLVKLYMHYYV